MKNEDIVLIKNEIYRYPDKASFFRPNIAYPEYPFPMEPLSAEKNEVYDSVRLAFHYLGLDEEHWGTEAWNPLGEVVNSSSCVLIKPNLVMEKNHIEENGTDCLFTHPAVVAAVIDYIIIANKGKGKIYVGDAPMQECRWEVLIRESGYQDLINWYISKGVDIELVDFRELESEVIKGVHVQKIKTDAKGTVVDLGEDSEFAGLTNEGYQKLRVTNYDPEILPTHHNQKKHEYYISEYVLKADVIFNMPKPKTHRKGGVTIALKNFVGINVRKEYLPHHMMGAVSEKGDEYLKSNMVHRLRSKLYDKRNYYSAHHKFSYARLCQMLSRVCTGVLSLSKNYYQEGSWYGNETIGKTITDLNKIVVYADQCGKMKATPQRKLFFIADMIVCGEKEGPVAPSAKYVGCIAAGTNAVLFDEAVSTLMGFDIAKIPTLRVVRKSQKKFVLVEEGKEAVLISNDERYNGKRLQDFKRVDSFAFCPTSGWEGHIELGE